MCKFCLRRWQMSASAFVDQSRAMARDIVNADVRGPGDLENAMRRVEARFGIPFSALWALRYRPPKDIGVSIYARLQAAHESVREAQMRKFTDEYERAKAASGADAPLVRAAAALVGKDEA